jgi:hypothetical protein
MGGGWNWLTIVSGLDLSLAVMGLWILTARVVLVYTVKICMSFVSCSK